MGKNASKIKRERMGIEPTHRLLGGAQDLKSWEGTSPQPLPSSEGKELIASL